MKKHDHELVMRGLYEGIPQFDLLCSHGDDDLFYMDEHRNVYDDCLIQDWWEQVGTEIIHAEGPGPEHSEDPLRWGDCHALLLWTAWDEFNDSPSLDGYHEHTRRMEEE